MDTGSGDLDRFKTLIESIDDWLWEVDACGLYTYASPQVEKILGYKPHEILGKKPLDFMTQKEQRSVSPHFYATLQNHHPIRLIETDHVHKDGHIVCIETSAQPIFDSSNKFIGMRGLDRDITARKEAEVFRNNLIAAVDQMAEAALFVDKESKITYVNQAFYDFFDYEEMEILGQPLSMLNPDPSAGATTNEVVHALKTQGTWEGEVLRRKADGSLLPVYLHASTIYEGKEIVGYTGTYLDLSTIQNAEGRLQASYNNTISAISLTIEKRDPYTAGHQNKVATLSRQIALKLGKDEEFIRGLGLGASIHDIGKIHIPAEILTYPGRLSSTEFELVKTHAQVGYDILKNIQFPWPVAVMVWQHHEKLDGSGYPNHLKDDEIIPEAKIIAVADVVDAVTSHRPYRPSKPIGHALNIIAESKGKYYDPDVVDAVVEIYEKDGFGLV